MQYFNKENGINIIAKLTIIFVIFVTLTDIYSMYFVMPKKNLARKLELENLVLTELISDKSFNYSDKDSTSFNFIEKESEYKKIKPFHEKGTFVYKSDNQKKLIIVWNCKNNTQISIEHFEFKE